MALFLGREDVAAAYRWILGREPDDEEAVRHQLQSSLTVDDLRMRLLRSKELRTKQKLPIFDERWVLVEAYDGGPFLWADLGDPGLSFDYLNGWRSKAQTAFLRKHCQPTSAVLDVGSGLGWFAIQAAMLATEGVVVSIEPEPTLHARQRDALSRLVTEADIYLEEAAAWNAAGALAMRPAKPSVDRGRSVCEAESFVDQAKDDGAFWVRADRLDRLMPAGFAPDFVFLDACGAEARVLLGAEDMLVRRQPVVLWTVYPDLLRRASGVKPDDVLAWMKDRGFEAHILDDNGALAEPIERYTQKSSAKQPIVAFTPPGRF